MRNIGNAVRTLIAICFILVAITSASAKTSYLGYRRCAEASVLATLKKQRSDRVHFEPNTSANVGVMLHLTFDVRHVLWGNISRGMITIIFPALAALNPADMWHLYLRHNDSGWRVADCVQN